MLRRRLKRQAGFTLIEIMVVIVIIGILASFIVPNIMSEPDKAKVVKAKADIKQIESALDMYRLDNYHYPSSEQGLKALVEKPSGSPEARNWREGGYLKHMPKDPWGNPYQYLNPGRHGPVDVYSLGADNQPGGEGYDADIGNWQESE